MELKTWFDKKDYATGLELFSTYSKNKNLVRTLTRKQSPAKLEYELRKIAEQKGIDLSTKRITAGRSGIVKRLAQFVETIKKQINGKQD